MRTHPGSTSLNWIALIACAILAGPGMIHLKRVRAIFFLKTFDYPQEDPIVPLRLGLGDVEVAALVVAVARGPLEDPEAEVEPAGERHGREVAAEA